MAAMASLSYPDPAEPVEHYPSTAERSADKLVHLVGMAISTAIGALLFAHSLEHTRPSIAGAIALYSVCAVAMLACSALYNLARPSRTRRLLQHLDETAIFMMIAGTCTPYLLTLPSHRWESTVLEWTIAAAGALARILTPRSPHRLWTALYIGYGAASVALIAPSGARLPEISQACLTGVAGAYCVGICAFLNGRLRYRRAVWHAMVVVALAVGFGALATGLVGAENGTGVWKVSNQLTPRAPPLGQKSPSQRAYLQIAIHAAQTDRSRGATADCSR
jgi:hemolysin III